MTAGGVRKYVVDTNLFIKGFRDRSANAELRAFHELFAPFEYLSAIVAQELLGGTRDPLGRGKLERHVLDVYTRRRRVVSPSARVWRQSGIVLAELVRREGLELHRVSKAFGNDVLLALSCRENGLVLVTDNTRDFERIRRITAFEFVRPWPVPRSASG